MTEDHSWAGDKRLIPPGGTLKPSKEIQGTLSHEAGEGVASKASASRNFDDATKIERVVSKSKSHDINNEVDNANADELQGATDERRKKKVGNTKVQESPGAIIKKIDNADARVKQGVIYCQRQEEFDKDLGVSIDTATRRSSTATDNDLKRVVGHGINDKDQEKGKRIEAESEDDNEKKTKSSGVQGAIIKDKTESVTDYGKQGAKVDHTKERWANLSLKGLSP